MSANPPPANVASSVGGESSTGGESSIEDVNARDKDGWTALHEAAFQGEDDLIRSLVQKGWDIHALDNDGNTPLHRAVIDKETLAVGCLLELGADPNKTTFKGYTPLHWAAWYGFDDIIKRLLANGANCMAKSGQGHTPLSLAQTQKHERAAEILSNFQRLLVAVCEGNIAAIQSLVVSGVEIATIILHVAAQNNQVSTIEYLLSEHKMDIDCKNYQGETPLHVAACDGHKEAVEYLLQRGAGINIQDKRGCTPLHWAAMQGHHSVVEILLAQGANCMATSQQGFTPLMLAQTQKYECAAEILLNFQKLLVAACEGDIAAIQSLVVSGVEIPTIILHVAAQNNQVSTIEYLLSEHKMDIDFKIKNANGESIWHIAAYYGIEEAIKYCLNKDIKNIDSKDGQGRTALHWAALCRRSELVEILIDSGANPTIQDKQRRTYEDLKPAVKASKKPMSLTNLRLRLSGNSMGYFATQQRSTMERCSAILKAIVLLLLASVMYAGFLLALHYLFKQLIAKDDKALNNGFDYNSEPKYNTQGTTPCLSLLK